MKTTKNICILFSLIAAYKFFENRIYLRGLVFLFYTYAYTPHDLNKLLSNVLDCVRFSGALGLFIIYNTCGIMQFSIFHILFHILLRYIGFVKHFYSHGALKFKHRYISYACLYILHFISNFNPDEFKQIHSFHHANCDQPDDIAKSRLWNKDEKDSLALALEKYKCLKSQSKPFITDKRLRLANVYFQNICLWIMFTTHSKMFFAYYLYLYADLAISNTLLHYNRGNFSLNINDTNFSSRKCSILRVSQRSFIENVFLWPMLLQDYNHYAHHFESTQTLDLTCKIMKSIIPIFY
jgi:hypothetical protein